MRELIPGFIACDDDKLDATYPISVTESDGVAAQYQRLHWHELFEINLIKNGTGYYHINGRTIEFERGDIVLINSKDLHRAFEREGLTILVITFSPSWFLADARYDPTILSPFKELGKHYANLVPREHARMNELRRILLTIQQENERKAFSHVSVIRAYLLRFLAYIGRECRIEQAMLAGRHAGASNGQHAIIREVLEIVDSQYAMEWDLKSLSERAYLSPARFSALFKQAVGVSPMEYVIQIRLSHAVRMLQQSDCKIVDVANECGFRNLSNFNRLFKTHIGHSPSLERRRSASEARLGRA
ncbi:helix-turn-helix domain-containing protein [Cohnella sp. GCM10027633]|uniref:helix-turn-helix domain-containing protein n=1 Tax=unclassified Cohnella TaxID=2636738 RepID=UPI00362704E3